MTCTNYTNIFSCPFSSIIFIFKVYFDKKRDFSIERIVSMTIRINYFPLLLSFATGTSLDLYYVVPLHTVGFFMTLLTCRLGFLLEEKYGFENSRSRIAAIAISLLAHVLFYETKAVDFLLLFSKEIHFRFQADKYSAWLGILCGYFMKKVNMYMSCAHGREYKPDVVWTQRITGAALILFWYLAFGHKSDKFEYNPVHPYIFIFPTIGWLMLRNSSKYLTQCHSTFLEFLGRNTLETYVLQFHLFMNHKVQFIPMLLPNSGPDGPLVMKVANMLVCGVSFVAFAVLARKVTVMTQISSIELTTLLREKYFNTGLKETTSDEEEAKPMIEAVASPVTKEDSLPGNDVGAVAGNKMETK